MVDANTLPSVGFLGELKQTMGIKAVLLLLAQNLT